MTDLSSVNREDADKTLAITFVAAAAIGVVGTIVVLKIREKMKKNNQSV